MQPLDSSLYEHIPLLVFLLGLTLQNIAVLQALSLYAQRLLHVLLLRYRVRLEGCFALSLVVRSLLPVSWCCAKVPSSAAVIIGGVISTAE